MLKIDKILCLLLWLSVSACTTESIPMTKNSAWLSPKVAVELPMVTTDTPIHVQQLLTAQVNNKEYSLVALLDIKPNLISLTGLSPLGIRLFSIHYDGKTIATKQNIMVSELPAPTQVLADILLSYGTIADWQSVLPKNWQLVDKDNQRYLIDDKNRTITQISYKEGSKEPLTIQQHAFSYRIAIKNMGDKL